MVQSKEKNIELGKNLPWGAKKVISDRTGVAKNTVSNFFLGKNVRYDISLKILREAKNIQKEFS
jgi:hypothetical protein